MNGLYGSANATRKTERNKKVLQAYPLLLFIFYILTVRPLCAFRGERDGVSQKLSIQFHFAPDSCIIND